MPAAAAIQVKPVASKEDMREWIRFPRQHVYGPCSPWVAPLDHDILRTIHFQRSPYFRHAVGCLLLARSHSGRVLGRVIAHINRAANKRHHERAVLFGFFECVDDDDAARALVSAVSQYGARRGCDTLRGPFNLTVSQEIGVVIDGFGRPPTVDLTYTAPYYPRILEAAGLRRVFPMSTYRTERLRLLDADALLGERQRAMLATGRLRIRRANMRRFHEELELIRELANDAFADSPYFVPITQQEFQYQIEPYRRAIDPALTLFAEYDGRSVGFAIATPDFNPLIKPLQGRMGAMDALRLAVGAPRLRHAVGTFMGVRREVRSYGIMRAVQAELVRALQQRHYQSLTVTWMAEDNGEAKHVAAFLGAAPLHRLTLYEAPVASLS